MRTYGQNITKMLFDEFVPHLQTLPVGRVQAILSRCLVLDVESWPHSVNHVLGRQPVPGAVYDSVGFPQ